MKIPLKSFTLILLYFTLAGCGEVTVEQVEPESDPASAGNSQTSQSGEAGVDKNGARVSLSEYEASRLRQEAPPAKPATAVTPPPAVTPDPQQTSQIAQENQQLKQQIEQVQNRLVQQNTDATRMAVEAKQLAENEDLKRKLAELEDQLNQLKNSQAILAPGGAAPVVPADPSVLQYTAEPPVIPNINYFFEPLAKLGNWIKTRDYGYVWSPGTGRTAGWHPYGNGKWTRTNFGWTWASNEAHGWATCHYGRWAQHAALGWLWVPDTKWAPAWVSWRVGNQQVGWAPLPPESRGINAFGPDVESRYPIPWERYVFLAIADLMHPQMSSRYLGYPQYAQCIRNTVNVTQIQGTHPHYVQHRGLERFSFLNVNPPSYDLRFDQLGHQHSSSCGTHLNQAGQQQGRYVMRVVQPGSVPNPHQGAAPQDFTQLNSTLYQQAPQPLQPAPTLPPPGAQVGVGGQGYPAPPPNQPQQLRVEDVARDLLHGWLRKQLNK